jgi:hypothetical protein
VSRRPPPPIRLTLRAWAAKLEEGTLSPDDVSSLAELIRRLADGESIDHVFGIRRPAYRPVKPDRQPRMMEMAQLTLPEQWGGSGLGVSEALKIMAERYNVKPTTMKRQYYSEEGQKARLEAKKRGQMIAELRDPRPWGGAKSPE